MSLKSQELRKIAPELDPLRLGTGWKLEDLSKPQIIIESTFGDSHPGSAHLLKFVQKKGASEHAISVQIFVTEKRRGMTALIILCLPEI